MKPDTNQTWNQNHVKRRNKLLVLDHIIKYSPISRATIATETGLNKGTVSSLVSDLIDDHLINESGPGKSSGGRRPVMLLFNETAGYSIGIDIGVNYLLGVLTDLNGIVAHEKRVMFSDLSYEQIETELFFTIDYLINVAPASAHGIVGIGVGVPGIVNKSGEILVAPNLHWKKVNLKTALEKRYHLPIIIENEANAGAYGEKKFGAGKDSENIAYVSVAIGIGVGLILNNSLYQGNHGFSGELGHMTINIDGVTCRCGNQGCWELYASEQALIHQAKQLDFKTAVDQELTLENLLTLAEHGQENAISLFHQIGDYLGIGINNIINIFNPGQVIIGNRMATSQKWIEESLRGRLEQSLWFQQNDLQISFSELSTLSTALGMAAFSIENFLQMNDTHLKINNLSTYE